MPTTKDSMTRLCVLDELLSDRYHNYSLDDITHEVNIRLSKLNPSTNGVVRRTIEKDIQYLEYQSPFNAIIERYLVSSYDHEKNKYYTKHCLRYEKPSFSIFKKDLSNDEEYLLREVLSLLGQFDGLPNLDGLENLRLGLSIPNEERKIISFTKNPLQGSSLLGQLFTCISNKQVIMIEYFTFLAPEDIHSCILHPYMLKEYNRRWYIIGAAYTDGKILSFSLDRINKYTPMPSYKYVESSEDLDEYFEDIVGVTRYEDQPIEHILFWVSDMSKDYLLTKPIHESQKHYKGDMEKSLRKTYPNLNNGSFFSLDCIKNYELIRELCSFGSELVVLSPQNICDDIYNRILNMKKQYDQIKNI